jgi:hypothetical protein
VPTSAEVLGFDTPRSMDHWWGPRLMLCLPSEDYTQALADEIRRVLGAELPFEIHGFPTHMEEVDRATGTVFMAPTDQRPINHMVSVTTARTFLSEYLGTQPLDAPLEPADWLAMPEQNLRTVASSGVWHDDIGDLTRARELLHWYPLDVWRYVLAAQWRRIEQEEAFPGRCAEVGDELGSRVVAARLVRELMHLAFLLERQYMPYSKWLGTAFARLQCSAVLQPCCSVSWRRRTGPTANAGYRPPMKSSLRYRMSSTWLNRSPTKSRLSTVALFRSSMATGSQRLCRRQSVMKQSNGCRAISGIPLSGSTPPMCSVIQRG